jgi:hypothetical protein
VDAVDIEQELHECKRKLASSIDRPDVPDAVWGYVMTLDLPFDAIREGYSGLERVMNLGENRIEMRIPRSAWIPRDLRFPHS